MLEICLVLLKEISPSPAAIMLTWNCPTMKCTKISTRFSADFPLLSQLSPPFAGSWSCWRGFLPLFTLWVPVGCVSVSLHVTKRSGMALLALLTFLLLFRMFPALADVFPFYPLRNTWDPFAVTFTEHWGCVSYLWVFQFGNLSSWSLHNALIVLLCSLLGLHFYLKLFWSLMTATCKIPSLTDAFQLR